jgi:putative flavoprotein involved in K+ transport
LGAADCEVDVLIIGGGQAGLATGRLLRDSALSFRIQERHQRIGDSWRGRHDSLTLFSSRAYCALPGLPLPGDPQGYPGKDEIADYLEQYARAFRLPVATGDAVTCLERGESRFMARTAGAGSILAKCVIVASGAFQEPLVPEFARRLAPEVVQLTPKTYRNPAQLPDGRCLIAGAGATGRQVALELAPARETWLSKGRGIVLSPQRFLGRDIIWWFDKLGSLRADKESFQGRMARRVDATPGLNLSLGALKRRGVRIAARTVGAEGRKVIFAGGRSEEFATVIWCMGYREDCSWIRIPGAVDETGRCVEQRGIAPVPGLFYVGRSWQNSRASALLCGVAADAAGIVKAAKSYLASAGPQAPTPSPGR